MKKSNVYVGTFTDKESRGIYKFVFDHESGAMTGGDLAAVAENPAFLALHPSGNWLYAVNELMEFEGEESGAVSAYSIAPETGELLFLNQQSSKGGSPCHVSVDPAGKWVLIANYMGGNAVVYPIEEGGLLGKPASVINNTGSGAHPTRQTAPHAHSITLDPEGRRAIVADLGIDKLLCFDLDVEHGALIPSPAHLTRTVPGAGPRHFTFHPSGAYAFVINELNSTITSFRYDKATGALIEMDTESTLPADYKGDNSCADIHVSPDGRYVYGSNRGHDSIAIIAFDDGTGALQVVGHESTRGRTPRNFTLDPTGGFLLVANQNSDSIFVFRRDAETGLLTSTGQRVDAPTPVCLRFA